MSGAVDNGTDSLLQLGDRKMADGKHATSGLLEQAQISR